MRLQVKIGPCQSSRLERDSQASPSVLAEKAVLFRAWLCRPASTRCVTELGANAREVVLGQSR